MRRNYELKINAERNGFEVYTTKNNAKIEAQLSEAGLQWDRAHEKMYGSPRVMDREAFCASFAKAKDILQASDELDADFAAAVERAYAAKEQPKKAAANKAAETNKAKKGDPTTWDDAFLLKVAIRRLSYADRETLLKVVEMTAKQDDTQQ